MSLSKWLPCDFEQCHPLLWSGGILVDHWSTISSCVINCKEIRLWMFYLTVGLDCIVKRKLAAIMISMIKRRKRSNLPMTQSIIICKRELSRFQLCCHWCQNDNLCWHQWWQSWHHNNCWFQWTVLTKKICFHDYFLNNKTVSWDQWVAAFFEALGLYCTYMS